MPGKNASDPLSERCNASQNFALDRSQRTSAPAAKLPYNCANGANNAASTSKYSRRIALKHLGALPQIVDLDIQFLVIESYVLLVGRNRRHLDSRPDVQIQFSLACLQALHTPNPDRISIVANDLFTFAEFGHLKFTRVSGSQLGSHKAANS